MLYSICFSQYLNSYVMECVVTWIVWYNRYYRITEEEYFLWKNDVEKLDELADMLYKSELRSERFLFSENKKENTREQSELLDKVRETLKNVEDNGFEHI